MTTTYSEPFSKEQHSTYRASLDSTGFVILEEGVPSNMRESLLSEITRSYSPGQTKEEREDVAYKTSCRSMVDQAWERWKASDRQSLTLNQLAHLMLSTAEALLQPASNLWCGPLQIAVREAGHAFPAPHIDGYGLDDKTPSTPRAIVGVYLTGVESREDGALLIWPARRKEIADLLKEERHNDARNVAESCKASDQNAMEVLGKPGAMFIIDGNVPHGNAERANEGLRIAVYLRVY
ncbi:phytanoyl-CoA dioxygenase family protein [Ralstonia flaminis]|jgi:hypothetical protein|uniref:Fe2OG dioxygenase domain-containing protein n=1 Tax=Ralstonia flaminis TaxID=3058597 RepID=A0ABM9KB19_9RALS|nr:phytanoyl-CoA dioxygenase family protein [Ralstonia sp. LMG 18101]CAJ0822455.1 hypothetical protein LMG18101_05014 [Ralstonia sp. LMG 18101]